MSEFYLLISGPDFEPVGRADLDCADQADAMRIASNVRSPYGHELFHDSRFLGRFDPAWGEHLEAEAQSPGQDP
jgi:hypothetical protein